MKSKQNTHDVSVFFNGMTNTDLCGTFPKLPDPAIPGTLAVLDGLGAASIVSPGYPLPGGAAAAVFSLAATVALHLHRTIVCVDACFTNPELSSLVPAGTPMLQEQLVSNNGVPQSIPVEDRVDVIACRKGGESDMALLCSPVYEAFMAILRKKFSLVLIMLPPAPAFAGMGRAARVTDGVVLMLDCERTRWEAAAECRRRLIQTGVIVVGAIMNRRRFHVPSWLYHAL